ncbi:hypothetical protein WME94_21130 [Sorangium sp. So ce429]
MANKTMERKRSARAVRPSLLLEIPLDRLPEGTRLQLDAKSLIAFLEARSSSVEVTIGAPDSPAGDAAAKDHFLSPAEMDELGQGEITVSEAAGRLGISRQAVLLAIKRDALKARRVGPVFLVDIASLKSYRPRQSRGRLNPSTADNTPTE